MTSGDSCLRRVDGRPEVSLGGREMARDFEMKNLFGHRAPPLCADPVSFSECDSSVRHPNEVSRDWSGDTVGFHPPVVKAAAATVCSRRREKPPRSVKTDAAPTEWCSTGLARFQGRPPPRGRRRTTTARPIRRSCAAREQRKAAGLSSLDAVSPPAASLTGHHAGDFAPTLGASGQARPQARDDWRARVKIGRRDFGGG